MIVFDQFKYNTRNIAIKNCKNKLIANIDADIILDKSWLANILEHLLKYFSNEGDVCLDMTMGSGSCGVACKTLNRKFIGIELNKDHFDIAKERLN